MPAGASFQANYIDYAVIGDAVGVAGTCVSCQGEAEGSGCAVVNGDFVKLGIGTGVAGEISLAHEDAAVAIAATGQLEGGASASGPVAAGIGGILPGGIGFQIAHIDSADVGDAVAIAGTSVSGQVEAGSIGCAVVKGDWV